MGKTKSKANHLIPYGRQSIDKKDIRAVIDVLKSDWITQGAKIDEFEKRIAEYCGAKYAVCVSSGTAALHLACLAGGLKKGDEAITTPITFVATPNSVLYAGAMPVFADIEDETLNINPTEIERKITKKTKAILPVHFAGLPCKMAEIQEIAKRNGLIVIEDACHALGSRYKCHDEWVKVGSCRHSAMTVFSFHPVKHITTGEGGAITTNNKRLYEKLKALSTHGIYKTQAMTKKHGSWYYEMRDLGFNCRITDFQCAMGISQLEKIDQFLSKRRLLANFYNDAFNGITGLRICGNLPHMYHAYHLYTLRVDYPFFRVSREKAVSGLREKGILVQVHYIPVYWQPYYRQLGYKKGLCPVAEELYKAELSIPIFPGLNKSDAKKVVSGIFEILKIRRKR